jgi:hypothetical protein
MLALKECDMTAANVCRVVTIATTSVFLFSCVETPTHPVESTATDPATTKPATAPAATATAEPVTGKTAYWEMYKMARAWAPDLTPLSLTNKKIPGHKLQGGKNVVWTAAFASPSKREVRRITYSVIAAPGVVKGPEAENAMAWAGPTRDAMPFGIAEIGVDSDEAYKIAAKRAESWLKAHPNEDLSMTLGNASRFHGPVWYVLWGNSKSGFQTWINATTGAVIEK